MITNDRIHRIAAIAGGAVTLAWVAFYGLYISNSLGLETLLVLPPDTVAGIVFALFLPPVLVWVLIAYWTRGRELARQTDRINAQLERLTISDNHATQRVNDLAGALKQQSAELERASAAAAEVVDRIRKQFKDQTAELESASRAAEAEAVAIDVRLAQQRLNLGDLGKTVTQQKDLLVEVAANQAKAIQNAAEDAARHVADAFAAKQPEMESVVDRILEHGGVVKAAIERQIEGLRNEAQQSAADFENASDGIVKRIDAAAEGQRRQAQQMMDATERLSGLFGSAADEVSAKMGEVAEGLTSRFSERIEAAQRASAEHEAALQRTARNRLEEANTQADTLVKTLEQRLTAISASRGQIAAAEAELRELLERQSGALVGSARDTLNNLHQQITAEFGKISEVVHSTEAKQRDFDQILARHVDSLGDAVTNNVRVLANATVAERDRLGEALQAAEERHKALANVMNEQRDTMVAAAEEASQKFNAALKRHQEMTAANATAIVADMMRKTGDVQRAIRDQGDGVVTAVRGLSGTFIDSLNRILDQIGNATERAQADSAALEQASRVQIDRMSHAAEIGAQHFRGQMNEMIIEVEALTKSVADKVIAHNTDIKTVMRSESDAFGTSAERAAQLFGRRVAELAREIENASGSVRERTEGLEQVVHTQGERLATAASDARAALSRRDRPAREAAAVDQRCRRGPGPSLAEQVDGLAGRLAAAADVVGERFGKRLAVEQETLQRLAEASDQRTLSFQQETTSQAERLGQTSEDLLARFAQRVAELRGEIDRHGGRLGDQANAAADRLRERVDLQIRSLGEVAAAVGRRPTRSTS